MRVFISLLLVAALAAGARPSSARFNPPAAPDDEQKLSPEEELEAQALLARFKERLRATKDFGPIVDELFVSDFRERLWQVPRDWQPWGFLDEILAVNADRAALRRHYLAWMNFYALVHELSEAARALKKQAGGDGEDEVKARDIFSPEIVEVLAGDRTLAWFAEEFKEKEDEESARGDVGDEPTADSSPSSGAGAAATGADAGAEGDGGLIKTPRQLEEVSSTLEKANELMRKRLAGMAAALSASPPASAGKEEGEEDSTPISPEPLDEDEYGFPAGTQVIHAEVKPFCVFLVRIDGRLQIMSVALYTD
ncbi:MAG TPA: hypothetical protein VD861_10015 [Pyrinomonadaceae bacterium]|nr:hypothetical protein [Pyrinomonadaceae bacterium]